MGKTPTPPHPWLMGSVVPEPHSPSATVSRGRAAAWVSLPWCSGNLQETANGQLSSYRQHYSGSTKCLVEPEQGTLLIKKPDSHIFLVGRHLNGGRVSAHLTPST